MIPGDHFIDFFQQIFDGIVQIKGRGCKFQKVEFLQPRTRALIRDPVPSRMSFSSPRILRRCQAVSPVHFGGGFHEGQGQFSDGESEALFESYGPQHARGILHEAESYEGPATLCP